MRKKNCQKGFTLIEVIAVLLIVGLLAAFAGLGIVNAVRGFMFSKDTAAISEKTQLALARINRELLECYNCKGASGADVSTSFINTIPGSRSIYLNETTHKIEISGTTPSGTVTTDVLLDNVDVFTMKYNTEATTLKSITVTIRSSAKPGGATVPDFVTIVYPRNTL